MATKTFKIGLSATDKQNMAQDVYERILDLTFPEYDTTASYSVGDFVVYNNQLYKCIGATSGTWDATKWQLATLNDLVEDIESAVAFVNDKANVDGNYPTMTVGNADQLNSTVYVVDKVPYLYRTSGGDADIGNREYDKIIGGSLVVNQLVNSGTTEITLSSGHKYYTFIDGVSSINNGTGQNVSIVDDTKDQVIDLTQMLGSTVADYIYALEQASAGAGVAWFKNYFQEEYYPYNAGAIKNVKLVSHDMVGFNQWDEEWEQGYIDANGVPASASRLRSKNFIRVLPNVTYYLFCGLNCTFNLFFYDDNNVFISTIVKERNNTITIPSNATKLKFFLSSSYGDGTTYNNDICINLSWSGWRNGQYEPYQKNSYPLDATIELRGIPKFDSNNHLYFDGDEYSSDGKVVRRYSVYTFTGNESWTETEQGRAYCTAIQGNAKFPSASSVKANILMADYVSVAQENAASGTTNNKVCALNVSGAFIVVDRSISSNGFASAMAGKTIVFELATTTEETATVFQEPQIVDDFGTEEYVVPTQDGWQIPVGHDTKYPANLRDKLQRLPDMPSVSQNVTETYVVNYNGTTKKCTFVDIASWLGTNGWIKLTDISGYDATATQVLKNVNGTLTWVDD